MFDYVNIGSIMNALEFKGERGNRFKNVLEVGGSNLARQSMDIIGNSS